MLTDIKDMSKGQKDTQETPQGLPQVEEVQKLEMEITSKFLEEYKALVVKYGRDFQPIAEIRIVKK